MLGIIIERFKENVTLGKRGRAMRGLLPVLAFNFFWRTCLARLCGLTVLGHIPKVQLSFDLFPSSLSLSLSLLNCLIYTQFFLTSSCPFFCTLFSFLSEWREVYFVYYYHDDNSVLRLYSLLFIMHYCDCFVVSMGPFCVLC